MKILTTLSILLLLSFNTWAQAGRIVGTVKGKVINSTTNEPVSYTNIGLEGTFFGTASDSEGNFELKIPQELVSKNIFFSAVGFKNKKFPVKLLLDKEFNVIKIESQAYGIDDVNVAAQNMVLIRILRMASENIPYNYIQGPYNLIGQYKNETVVNNVSTKQNAEVLIYDKNGYTQPSKENAFQSLKYAMETEQSDIDYSFSTGTTNLDELLNLDWVRSASSVLNPAISHGFQLKLVEEPTINAKDYWKISFKQQTPTLVGSGDFYATAFEGQITINKEDYSILKIEGKIESSKNNRQGKHLAVSNSNTLHFTNLTSDFVVEYENLKPSQIVLNKTYLFDGKIISEKSSLKIIQAKVTNVTLLNSRQYFTGK